MQEKYDWSVGTLICDSNQTMLQKEFPTELAMQFPRFYFIVDKQRTVLIFALN